tara:strand:- start:908 stop:2737 length:1830 start_codon:yes stop_codon:yes gene_type:complete
MPRKQNGFGNFKGLAVKSISSDLSVGKFKKAGDYPSDRRYGSSVKRSVIEHYNLDSDWVKWRKGVEYYYRAASFTIYKLDSNGDPILDNNGEKERAFIDSKLYQGTNYEIDIEFSGYRFATKNSDTRNHYVVKRKVKQTPNLGTISQVYNDQNKIYAVGSLSVSGVTNKAYKEIWLKATSTSDLLVHSVGERLTDTKTEATLKNVLNDSLHPAVYVGKTEYADKGNLKITVPLSSVLSTSFVTNNNNDVQALVDQVGSLGAYTQEIAISNEVFEDDDYQFYVSLDISRNNQTFRILNNTTNLSPGVLDVSEMATLYETSAADLDYKAKFTFNKEYYQRFFGNKYLTGDLVKQECNKLRYGILPFTIRSVLVNGSNLEITATPFEAELKLFSITSDKYLVFTDNSFTLKELDTYGGEDYHAPGDPANPDPWYRIDTDIDPWMDEVFTAGQPLTIPDVYCCSCPSFSHAIIRMPETTSDQGKRITNRQYRYPLPTAMSKIDLNSLASQETTGILQSWETFNHKSGFKMCKHTIAARFKERIKVKEPNKYPTIEAREAFESKLLADISEVGHEVGQSYKRSGLSNVELVYTLAEGLNLDEIEIATVVLGTKF